MLLGQAFAFIDIHPRRSSFLATALLDLAAFSGTALYADMVNDVKAVRIVPEYWQPQIRSARCALRARMSCTIPMLSSPMRFR